MIAGIERLQPLQRRCLLHHRPRRGHRKGSVAHVDRLPGRVSPAAIPGAICRSSSARGRRRVDSRQLRRGREPRLLGHGSGEAVGARGPRHRRRRSLHELHTRARSRHRKMKWYYQHLPGETQDMDEVFENILIDVGGRKSLVTMGKLGDSLAARSHERRIHPRHAISSTRTILDVNPQTGKVTYRPGKIPQVGVAARDVPQHRGVQELASHGVQPADQRAVHPDEPELRTRDFRSGWRKSSAAAEPGRCQRKDYKHPASGGNLGEFQAHRCQNRQDIVAASHGIAFQHRRARHGRRPRVRRRLGSSHVRVRCGDRSDSLADAAADNPRRDSRSRISANGKQYVAMPAGIGGGSWSTLISCRSLLRRFGGRTAATC